MNRRVVIPVDRFWPEYAGWIKHSIKMIEDIEDNVDLEFEVWTRNTKISAKDNPPKKIKIRRVGLNSRKFDVLSVIFYTILVLIKLLLNYKKISFIYLPHTRFPGFIFISVARLLNISLVARNAGGELKDVGTIAQKIRFKSLSLCNKLVVLNREDKRRLQELNIEEDKITYIPNGVDIKKFSPPKNTTNNGSIKNIGFLGIISRRKGIHDLVKVFKSFKNDQTNELYLKIAGPIEEVAEVKETFIDTFKREINNETSIRYIGVTEFPHEFLKEIDIFVLPSYSEGMPNVLLEAMSSGLPCIATRIAGVNEVIEDYENGILYEPGNLKDLHDKLFELVSDNNLQCKLSKKARETILSNFSLQRMSDSYKELFNSIKVK